MKAALARVAAAWPCPWCAARAAASGIRAWRLGRAVRRRQLSDREERYVAASMVILDAEYEALCELGEL